MPPSAASNDAEGPGAPPQGSPDGRGAPAGSRHEIRAAKLSIDRTGHGVTLTLSAGKLRLRLYIESQWNDLIRQISAGKGELDQLVPFRMAPFEVEDDAQVVTVRTVNAQSIPGLSADDALVGTPLWEAAVAAEESEEGDASK